MFEATQNKDGRPGVAPIFKATHVHKKTGGRYAELFRGTREHDLEPVVIYQATLDSTIWVRPASEFDDGRFEPVCN